MAGPLFVPPECHRVSLKALLSDLDLFNGKDGFPTEVNLTVPVEDDDQFASAIEEGAVEITNENLAGLWVLASGFHSAALAARLRDFRSLAVYGEPTAEELQARIAALEEWALMRERQMAVLRARSTAGAAAAPYALSAQAVPSGFASLIVAGFPWIFAEFGEKRFTLLWRGSRDGFHARDFHRRCDGRANTLTLIRDTKGNIFGGFTPLTWEARDPMALDPYKADRDRKSFLFTLKNPHGVAARKFLLKEEMKEKAIICRSLWGPCFCDIGVLDDCDANYGSYACHFGQSYANDTALEPSTFFTGARTFTASEIEVFEITD
jgi:hypothetical protein